MVDLPFKGSRSSSKSPASPTAREYNDRISSRYSYVKSKRERRKSRLSRSERRKASNIHARRIDNRQTDALNEYLHLTASAVKINYPTVNATSKELIEMVKSMPFYQAHDHLNRYMMDRLRWEQIQQNKLLQLKAAAIQSQKDHQLSQQSAVTRLFKVVYQNMIILIISLMDAEMMELFEPIRWIYQHR